jgi:hypothetical protein
MILGDKSLIFEVVLSQWKLDLLELTTGMSATGTDYTYALYIG